MIIIPIINNYFHCGRAKPEFCALNLMNCSVLLCHPHKFLLHDQVADLVIYADYFVAF